MKTKIIYISGQEVFDMTDIRAAFEEVRGALNLGADTVLFGVPVDAEDALSPAVTAPQAAPAMTEMPDTVPAPDVTEVPAAPVLDITPVPEPVIEASAPAATMEDVKPAPKKSRGRPRAAKKPVDAPAPIVDATPADAPTVERAPAAIDAVGATPADAVVPILSVLATGPAQSQDDAAPETPATPEEEPSETTTVSPVDAAPEFEETVIQTVTIEDMVADAAPDAPHEKTLEELLESMTPLREDHGTDEEFDAPISDSDTADAADDTDATLAQLATEFAENQDKIVPIEKPESHGKIGKLKNILPFKKVKRDDAGIMGDLFGWAGIAANDEEFSMPGFFTNAAGKN